MTEGYVYAIESGDAVKIGFAHDPVRRLAELNVGSPGTHRLLGYARGTKEHERELHRMACGERIRGEWFRKGRVISLFLAHLPPYVPKAPCEVAPDKEAFRNVVVKLRSQAELSRLTGRPQTTVAYWAKTGVIPAEDAVKLEQATHGEIPRWMSRPDLWDAPAKDASQ